MKKQMAIRSRGPPGQTLSPYDRSDDETLEGDDSQEDVEEEETDEEPSTQRDGFPRAPDIAQVCFFFNFPTFVFSMCAFNIHYSHRCLVTGMRSLSCALNILMW